MNYFPCQCDLAGSKPISWVWPVTWILELPDAFLQHRLWLLPQERSAEGTPSSNAELIEGGVFDGVFYCKMFKCFSEDFPKL